MQLAVIQRILGILLALFSLTMVPPMGIAWWSGDGSLGAFAIAFLIILGSGLLLWLPVCKVRKELRLRDGFVERAATDMLDGVAELRGERGVLAVSATDLMPPQKDDSEIDALP